MYMKHLKIQNRVIELEDPEKVKFGWQKKSPKFETHKF